jgi:pimeloyl-ACP methyl ester carboxylesterase
MTCIIAVVVITGWFYQSYRENQDVKTFPPRGHLVDIGDHALHIYCIGSGTPTVILEAGLGNMVLAWNRVQPQLAKISRVCAYDRAGFGHSEAGPFPRSGEQIVSELELLVEAAEIQPPFVLVGHSNGALYARLYERRHQDEVAGLVLVDPSPENASECDELPRTARTIYASLVAMADIGVPRLLLPYIFPINGNLSADEKSELAGLRARSDFLRALWSERGETCRLREITQRSGPPEIGTPVELLSAEYARPGTANPAAELHRRLAYEFEGTRLNLVEDSGHWIQRDRPNAVVESVERVINEVRSKKD